jgi:hypothetical protein
MKHDNNIKKVMSHSAEINFVFDPSVPLNRNVLSFSECWIGSEQNSVRCRV